MHTCSRCGVTKDLSEFYLDPRRGTPMWGCKPCRREYDRSPERVAQRRAKYHRTKERDPAAIRRWNLKRVHNLTVEQYDALLAAQGGVCAICGTPPTGKHPLYVDHDHACCPPERRKTCGKCVRGLLCPPCNSVLGRLRDDPAPLVRYLAEPPAAQVL